MSLTAPVGRVAQGMSDAEIEQVRDQLFSVARVVVASLDPGEQPFSEAIASLPEDQRTEAEERAAILEFEGKLTRDQAERLAISKYLRLPPRV